jgi:uncharacterized protein
LKSPLDLTRTHAYLEWIRRRAWGVLVLFLLLTALAGYLATRLQLRAEFSELLPQDDPAVVELNRLLKRVGASAMFVVLVEGEPEKNRLFAEHLVGRLKKEPAKTWRSISYEIRSEQAFFEKYAFLYADLQDIQALHDTLKHQIALKKTGAIDFDEGESIEALQQRLLAKYRQKYQDRLIFPSGYIEGGEGNRKLLVLIRPEIDALGGDETDRIYHLVDDAVKATRKGLGDKVAGVETIYTGNIPTILQEKQALKEDLGLASVTCILLVCLVIALYFRQARAVFLVATPALLGTLFAFAVAYLTIGYLNSNTAFLGSIILGNGINYAIVFLARYREERLRGLDQRQALARSIALTWKPTLASAVGASTAYGSLMITRFRGFNQFGVIGFVGMLLCWGVTFVLVPALIFVLEDLRPPKFHTVVDGQRSPALPGKILGRMTRAVLRRPGLFLTGALALFLTSLVPILQLGRDPFEYDFTKLRNKKALTEGPASHLDEVVALFGRQLSPAILATSSPALTQEARQKIAARDEQRAKTVEGRECVGRMETLSDFLPEHQAAKLAILEDTRALLSDDVLGLATGEERRQIEQLRERLEVFFPGGKARPLSLQDLPGSIAAPYSEKDGSRGKLLQVERGPTLKEHNGKDLICFAAATTEIHLSDGSVASATGNPAAVFSDMVRAIIRDGPRATAVALGLVAILIFVTFRNLTAWATVMATLLLGVSTMLGIAVLSGMRLNFLNFVAIPITFGIASEYGVNLYERGHEVPAGEIPNAMMGTGGAVALCSSTTIIGYGTLLLSDNQALNSFGQLAGLGEITTLLCAMIIVPAALALKNRRAARRPAPKP